MGTSPQQDRPGAGAAPIVRLAEREVFSNRFIQVFDDPVRFADGREGNYLRIVQSGGLPGVAVLPVANDHVGLVRVFRYPTGEWEWGVPRGLAHGGSPERTARQELDEEIGASPCWLTHVGRMTPDSGLLASVVHLYLAGYTVASSKPRDTLEISAIRWVHVQKLLGDVASGQVVDVFTLAALCCASARGMLLL
jgi:8-oxo-dGTP pyrophosphatase MutT (NUDIX family)